MTHYEYMNYTPLERRHSQLSFDTLIVKIGPHTAELHGMQVLHENGKNVQGHIPVHESLSILPLLYTCTTYTMYVYETQVKVEI